MSWTCSTSCSLKRSPIVSPSGFSGAVISRRARVFLLLAIAICTAWSGADAQAIGWAWMGGSSAAFPSTCTVNYDCSQNSAYGTEYQFGTANAPGGRAGAVTWTGLDGKLWLFGGLASDDSPALPGPGYAPFVSNAFWVFDPAQGAHGEWAWMGGYSLWYSSYYGTYGTEYQFDAFNLPAPRSNAVSWTGQDGRLWLFGGAGSNTDADWGYLNDLWVFDPTQGAHGEWAWMGGSNSFTSCLGGIKACGQSGVYGTEYVFNASNIPGSRDSAVSWTDKSGRFWLYGGWGYDSAANVGYLNDLWVFDSTQGAHGEWAWMGGANTVPACYLALSSGYCGQPSVPGIEYQSSVGNTPGGRASPASWTDPSGRLWLFGGEGFGSNSPGDWGYLDDLWVFDLSQGAHGEWAWMGGSIGNVYNQPIVYGTEYQFASVNIPGGRWGAVSWSDQNGRFWLFGGSGFDSLKDDSYLNDLWVLDTAQGAHGEWAWMGGSITDSSLGAPNIAGTEYQTSTANIPGSRNSPAGWTDKSGRFWLLGGANLSSPCNNFPVASYPLCSIEYYNDLWSWQILTSPPVISPASGNYNAPQVVTISDSTAGATIYYTTDGTAPTIKSTPYFSAITVSANETIQAIAVSSSYPQSDVAVATYYFPAATATTLSSLGDQSPIGATVILTATVRAVSGSIIPAGTVQLTSGGTPVGLPVVLTGSGVAAFITSQLPPGTSNLAAVYTPTDPTRFSASISPVWTQTVYNPSSLTGYVYFNGAVRPLGSGFNHPYGVAVDSNGNVFVADTLNGAVKEIVAASNYVTTNILGSGFITPTGIAADANGNIFVADPGNNTVFELASSGGYATVANLGRGFYWPYGVAVDASDNIYVADTGHGQVKTMAPCASCGGGYGYATTLGSGFMYPWGVAVDANHNVFVTDVGNATLKEVLAAGNYATVNTLGSGFFINPNGVAVDAIGDLFVSDVYFGTVREVPEISNFTTVSTPGYGLNVPVGVAVDAVGNLFVADTYNSEVKEISQTGGNFGSVKVSSAGPSTISMTFFFDGSITLGAPAVLAQQGGAASLDFADAGTGTCKANTTYALNNTCTVDVTFVPTQLGTRTGTVELLDGSGNVLALGSVQGTGTN